MSPTQTENLEAMQRAEEATVVLGAISGYVDSAIRSITNNLVAHYRTGQISHDVLVGGVGEISALMSLVGHLAVVQRTGEAAAKKEFANGKEEVPAEEPGARPGTRGAGFRRSQPA